jgi:hypothetical protein
LSYLRRSTGALLVALLVSGAIGSLGGSAPAAPTRASLQAYRGLGTWVDIYDKHQWAHIWKTVHGAKAHGVRTIYLETGNYHSNGPVFRPRAAARFIDIAHKAGIEVVAWYLPGFDHLRKDYRRTIKAIDFATPDGQSFDGLAMDIEATNVRSIPRRERRMLRLSRHVRNKVGDGYPLGAIIPSPSDMEAGSYWGTDFPFKAVAHLYDVFLPMSYSSFRASGLVATHDYIQRSIRIIRRRSEQRGVPIHVIGGLADGATGREVTGFVRAVREYGVLGASYYDYGSTGPEDWAALAKIRANVPQKPVLPLKPGYEDAVGNLPGGDVTHPEEAYFRFPPDAGKGTISFEAYDVQPGELNLWVNWHDLGPVDKTAPSAWGPVQTVTVANRYLRDDRLNFISFVSAHRDPHTTTWGIRNFSLTSTSP